MKHRKQTPKIRLMPPLPVTDDDRQGGAEPVSRAPRPDPRPPLEDDSGPRARNKAAQEIGRKIRAAMMRRGMILEGGQFDVRQLATSCDVRWQTAQKWVNGSNQEPPKPKNLEKISAALGITLEELLIGRSKPQAEPDTDAWRAFVKSPAGRSMTSEERAALAGLSWPGAPPDSVAYQMILQAFRQPRY